MAQKMLDIKNFRLNNNLDKSCQTSDDILNFTINLSKNKYFKFYKSKIYRDFILTFNVNKSKKIVLDRSMFKILRDNISRIEHGFMVCRV